MSKRTILLSLIGLGALAIIFYFVGKPDTQAQKEAAAQEKLIQDQSVPVTFIFPKAMDIPATLDVSGPLKTLDEVSVGAKVPGRLTIVTVHEGSRVRRGQLMAKVETQDLYEEIRQAQAALTAAQSAQQQAELSAAVSPQQSMAAIRQAEAGLSAARAKLALVREGARPQEKEQAKQKVNDAKARLDKAQVDLDRAKRLYAGDAIAKADVDAAQLGYDSSLATYRSSVEAYDAVVEGARPQEISQAEDAVDQAEAQVRLARSNSVSDRVKQEQVEQAQASVNQARASLHLAQMQLADAAIYAPVDGYVSGKPAQVGQVVNVGSPIATVVGLKGVYFEGQIPETEISEVKAGQRAVVRMDALPGRTFVGSVVAIDPVADSLGRQFSARIAITATGGLLKPGMFGRAEILLKKIPNAITLPLDAVLKSNGEAYVFVANGTKARKVPVRLGRVVGQSVQVSGVGINDKVILKGKDSLTDGATIREDKPAAKAGTSA
ncbi:MAG TPA: efflux RND transporter periplasmic adaptor subunit [Fimbriimonadales bacterium]|nr:efflux RND transporter periplasmic adaptor subunit [Fimbriimonadales bacterium]